MSYNYCKDHRSGITYVYEISNKTDESGKRTTSRKLIGKLDEAGNIIPTSGRRGRLPKPDRAVLSGTIVNEEQYVKAIEMQKKQIEELKEMIEKLRKEKADLISGIMQLLKQAK